MKKAGVAFLLTVCLVFTFMLTACNEKQGGANPTPNDYVRPADANVDTSFTATSDTLVVYFSKTNTTKGVAQTIQQLTDADIFEIERKEPYPAAYQPTTEVAKDEKEDNARPELATYLPDDVIAQYDTILLGFPIWWHTAPMPVLSFLNYYDLSGKTVYTFATSGGSPIRESTADIRNNTKATVREGRLFNGSNETTVRDWLIGLGLLASTEPTENTDDTQPTPPDEEEPSTPTQSKILIVYFTAESGNTERLANYIHSQIGGDTVKIEAAQPYTPQELNYSISDNRPEVEKAQNARPAIAQSTYEKIDIARYDTVFIGYPIWWWTAPMIVGTFLEHYDLTGYDIYPFSQSASMNTAHFTTSMAFVRECAAKKGAPTVHDGLFARATSTATIDTYLTANGFIGR